jgi:hypothetical protein
VNDRKQQDIGRQGARQRQDRFARGVLRQFWLGFQGLKTYSGQLTRAIAPN